jgi:hypothetical protein
LKVEVFLEVRLGEDRARTHACFEFKKGSCLGESPMPSYSFLCKVEEWSGNFEVIWDEVPIVPSEAKELANFSGVLWGLPLPDAIQLVKVHTHLIFSNYYSQIFNFILGKLIFGWL